MADFRSLAARVDGHVLRHLGGEPCTFHGVGLSDVSTTPSGALLLAVFEANHAQVELNEDGVEVQTIGPAAWLRVDELALPSGRVIDEGDELTVAGERWGIERAEHDSIGPGVLLILTEKVAP